MQEPYGYLLVVKGKSNWPRAGSDAYVQSQLAVETDGGLEWEIAGAFREEEVGSVGGDWCGEEVADETWSVVAGEACGIWVCGSWTWKVGERLKILGMSVEARPSAASTFSNLWFCQHEIPTTVLGEGAAPQWRRMDPASAAFLRPMANGRASLPCEKRRDAPWLCHPKIKKACGDTLLPQFGFLPSSFHSWRIGGWAP